MADPSTIFGADLVMWLRRGTGLYTDLGTTLATADDQHIEQWSDQSGNGFHWTKVSEGSNERPRYATGFQYLGFNTVKFNSSVSGQWFEIPDAAASVLNAASAAEMFVTIKAFEDTPAAGKGAWSIGSVSDHSHFPWTDGHIYDIFGSTVRKDVGNPATDLATNYNVYDVYSASADWQAFLNNSSIFSTGTNTFSIPASGLLFGISAGLSFPFVGWVAEVVIVKRKATGTERNNVYTYLTTGSAPSGTSRFSSVVIL
jgi:hypothetical protein